MSEITSEARQREGSRSREKVAQDHADIAEYEHDPKYNPFQRESSPRPDNFHENQPVTDISIPWLYEAHAVTLLFTVIIIIFYFSTYYESKSTEENIWHGIYMAVFVFLAVGCLVFPAGPFIRPHPIFWRLIFGISVIYVLLLVLLLFQSPNVIRTSLALIDPNLGKPIPERDYATHCDFSFEIIQSVMDRFVLAHFFGWFLKGLLVRNRSLLWAMSILWELVELSTKYFIPNFAECWWDSIILDVLICNAGGIELALFTIRKLDLQHYEWHSIFEIEGIFGKFSRFAFQFTPFEMEPMYFEPLASFKLWCHTHILMIWSMLIDLNGFLFKLFLWIPVEHSIHLYRIGLIGLVTLPAARQYYFFASNPNCKKMGSQSWILLLICILELGIIFKTAPDDLPHPPLLNKIFWAVGFPIYIGFSFIMLRSYHHVHMD